MTIPELRVGALKLDLKLVAIPALSLILLAVLPWPGRREASPGIAPTEPAVRRSARAPARSDPNQIGGAWPTLPIDEIAGFNLFGPLRPRLVEREPDVTLLADSPPTPPSDAEPQPAPIDLGKVQALYRDGRGAAAIVDARVVRVGDELADGNVVVRITEREVLVKRP